MSLGPASESATDVLQRRSIRFSQRLLWGLYAGLGWAGLVVFVAAHALGPTAALALLLLPAAVIALGERRGVPLWLVVVPGLAPVADLALWTGQIFLTESDALVLLAIAVNSFVWHTRGTIAWAGRVYASKARRVSAGGHDAG